MKIFSFDSEVGQTLDAFGSLNLILSRIAGGAGRMQVVCMHLGPGGLVGYHQAVVPQLFLVVQGQGWVRGEGLERVPITAGQAAFWDRGEGHEAGTDTGMSAVVVEAEILDLVE